VAEIYPLGQNRIFYRPQGFTPDLDVWVVMVDTNLVRGEKKKLDKLDHKNELGLYYFWYTFSKEGTYVGIFYEGDKKVTSQAYSTRRLPTDGGFRSFLGNNVINT